MSQFIAERRLPGITFQTILPPPSTLLPRMDIAAFVGLASRGPLHVPVAVEDIDRFRDIFGPDLALAWDTARGQQQTAYLGYAVEHYFRNGGRRCWVIRVAERVAATTFPLPGIVRADTLAPAECQARCMGSWADSLRVGTVLVQETLRIEFVPTSPPDASLLANVFGASVAAGDLLRVALDEHRRVLFLAVTEVQTVGGRQTITAQPYWFELESPGSPPETEQELLPAEPVELPEPPQAALRQTFDLWVWQAEKRVGYLPGLGFHPAHPRFWEKLPVDEQLFAPFDAHGAPREPDRFEQEVARPRFPLAFAGEPAPLYLPLTVSDTPSPDAAAPAQGIDAASRLTRDGLDAFSARLFLDPDLGAVSAQRLLAEAEDKHYIRGQALTGLHGVLPLDEVTLLAVPDAVQPGWQATTPEPVRLLDAPVLVAAGQAGESVRVAWQPVARATAYVLQSSETPDFASPQTAQLAVDALTHEDAGDLLSTLQPVPVDCPRRIYYRVRARRGEEQSAWSNTLSAVLPVQSFLACEDADLPAPVLTGGPLDGRLEFVWTGVPRADTYLWQAASDSDFTVEVKPVVLTTASFRTAIPDRLTYYRVRSQVAGQAGAWSNTVAYIPPPQPTWVANPWPESATDLLAVQRGLLRFCAARGDLLAVMSLPPHLRTDDALRHRRELLDGREYIDSGGLFVPPLDALERISAPSYAALYHPWLVALHREGTSFASVPPDGAVAGLIAHRVLSRGAWVAPANEALAGIVSLAPAIPADERQQLYDGQINLIFLDPRGYLALSAQTLAADPDLQPINVRLLLILLRRLALREGQTYVFEPNNRAFHRLVQHRFDRLMGELYAQGAFAGATAGEAFLVVTGESVNTAQSIDQGRFVVELRVAPSKPLAFITVRLVQTERTGATVTEV